MAAWMSAPPCFAAEFIAGGAVIDRWYAALLAADRGGLSDLLADDARIRLDDLGIEQNKQEFLDSMDEWQASAKGAAIRHRVEKNENGVSTVIACYDFPGNDLLMREVFAISGAVITAGAQARIADNCDSF
ncbi:MAG TPA: nuclear transport factor 2 family protein [Mesorhizobium sp.]